MRLKMIATLGLIGLALANFAEAQAPAKPTTPAPAGTAGDAKPQDETALGELIVTGTQQERLPRIAILPSLAPDLEDVIVRGVVRRDFELTGFFDVLSDSKAPPGTYGFDDPVDVDAWRKVGAESIVKVAARAAKDGKIEVYGLAYFLNVGKEPVYQKKILVDKSDVRVTAHRVTDALLGALTGKPGGFASQFTFSGKWGRTRRIFRMDSDGHALTPLTESADTAIAPVFGKGGSIYYLLSRNYSPYSLMMFANGKHEAVKLPFSTSVYSISFDKTFAKLALAVGESSKSTIYSGNADGSGLNKVSNTELSTKPVFSPSGKLAWVGGSNKQGSQRIYVDGKAVSPNGFTAASPTFCNTEDGVRLVYSVAVGGDRQDLVMSNEKGQGMARLTQNQGTNSHPACSPDGRLLAFFSTRNKQPGIYMMSLKSFRVQQLSSQQGESLVWAPLPAPATPAP
jgi:TolB protein